MYNMHHPKSDVYRLYLFETKGGRGLVQLAISFKTTTVGLDKCLEETEDTILHFVKDQDRRKSLYSISKESMKFGRELDCLQYHLQRMRRTPPMPAEQRPRPNTRLVNSSGPSGNQNRSTANTRIVTLSFAVRAWVHAYIIVSVTILWDMPIHTDAANRQDIVLKNKKDKTCLLMTWLYPRHKDYTPRYKEFEIEVERLCGPKTMTVPVVMGALDTIKKDMENYTNKIPGNIIINELQKYLFFLQPTFLGGSSLSSRNPPLPPKVHYLDSDGERENHSQSY